MIIPTTRKDIETKKQKQKNMNNITKHETCIHFKNYTKIVIEVQREFE